MTISVSVAQCRSNTDTIPRKKSSISKYTDSVVSESFIAIGLNSVVVSARADAADVQARGNGFSLVADAKAFRLSRTAKNQKDFKSRH